MTINEVIQVKLVHVSHSELEELWLNNKKVEYNKIAMMP
jgi:hypothetical protein